MITDLERELYSSYSLEFSEAVDKIFLSNADRVTPKAKKQLSGLLKYYAKKPHPFTACVRDNRKRFGNRAENVCAVLKDIIRGTTKWRGKNNPRDKGTPGVRGLSETDFDTLLFQDLSDAGIELDPALNPVISDEMYDILTNLSEDEVIALTDLTMKENV
jgi:hypothetical protein